MANLIERGDCESETPPMIFDETVPVLSNATFARDIAEAHGGTYSYKVTKTIAAGGGASIYLQDNINTDDMHGLVAGYTYTFSKWAEVPSASGIALSEVYIILQDYASAAWAASFGTTPTAFDTWQKISITRTIRAAATGVKIQISIGAPAEDTEYFYIDDIHLQRRTAKHLWWLMP